LGTVEDLRSCKREEWGGGFSFPVCTLKFVCRPYLCFLLTYWRLSRGDVATAADMHHNHRRA
ncbi:hypothetical protein BgiMline_030509, partial [Biomphalaria glabrata]